MAKKGNNHKNRSISSKQPVKEAEHDNQPINNKINTSEPKENGYSDDLNSKPVDNEDTTVITQIESDLEVSPKVSADKAETSSDHGNQINESSNSATPTPISSPSPPTTTKKRLTLQERLALATKGNKGKSKKQISSSPAPLSPTVSNTTNDESEMSKETEGSKEAESKDPQTCNSMTDSLEHEIKKLNSELSLLQLSNQDLNNQIKKLKSGPSPLSSSSTAFEKEKKELLDNLSSKDETIQQLLKEGEALSVKELKLNDTIKKLKSINNDLETSLHDYSAKNEEVSFKLNELEDFLKVHKFKSINQLIDNFNELSNKLVESTTKLEREKSANWENKYKEQQNLYNDELSEKKQILREINELKIQFEMSKKQYSLDLDSKDAIINDLKKEIVSIKDINSNEIARLENKIETLRLENETSQVAYKSNSENANVKTIDYDEYAKLSATHHSLQQQFLSSQENWKLIESNLLTKVDNLTSSIDSLKKSKIKLSNDLKNLQNSLQLKSDGLVQLNEKYESLLKENDESKLELSLKDNDHQELQDKFNKFKQIYNTDRQNLNNKIKKLNEVIEKYKTNDDVDQQNQSSSISARRAQEMGLNINIEPPRFPFRAGSSNSIHDSSTYNNWQDIKFGESSTTPAISKDFSGLFMNPYHNNSSNSFTENGCEDSFDDTYSFNSRYQNHAINPNSGSISATIPASSSHSNIQLINKMSSNIRRLEIELNTLKEENNQLSLEKEKIQQELLEKLKLTDEVDNLNYQINKFTNEINERSKKEQTMLELIGEKSEQVEELKADVQDLKDLCKLQVQQMIELQESK